MLDQSKQRVIVYIDGFNLYFGLKKLTGSLNLELLAKHLLKPNQELVKVNYFTARISSRKGTSEKQRRQNAFLEAVGTLPNTYIHYGHFLEKQTTCRNCGAKTSKFEEKMTDVNIAVELLRDAMQDQFDTALLISVSGGMQPDLPKQEKTYKR
tara:strand:- start:136 stop:594 length:459 start_codon:yes stop_codon:yes gene_type:complete